MDFVSKALGSLNMGLPFTLGEQVQEVSDQPWKLYDATYKKDGSDVSVFDYEEMYEGSALNTTAALRKLKLPGIAKHIETVNSGKRNYIVTERVKPFDFQSLSSDARKYILQSTLQTLDTLYTVAKCKHNCICKSTVLQSSATGKPLLVGFDLATIDGLSVPGFASLYNSMPLPPSEGWMSPTLDAFQFGLLIADVMPEESRIINSLKANKRPTISKLAASKSIETAFRNPISDLVAEISQVLLLAPHDLTSLCEQIDKMSTSLYPGLIKGTLLPELLKTKNVSILRTNFVLISALVSNDNKDDIAPLPSDDVVSQYIVSQFQSMDRVVRLELLRFLPQYIALLSDKVVQQSIMPKMVFGFGDNEVILRKASVAAVEYLTSKLTTRQLNSELLRMLAKTHNDVDPDVRSLTTTVLCRLAPRLESRSVISTALGRALKDPSPKCRNAALRGVSQIDVSALEIAEKLLGPTATGMLDKDPNVSAEAWRVTDELLKKIREGSTSKGPASGLPVHEKETIASVIPPLPANNSSSRFPTPDAPSAVPSPLSTLQHVSVQKSDTNTRYGDIHAEPDAWGWEANDDPDEDDEDAKDQVEDAWGWDEPSADAPEVEEDAWGW